MLILGTTKQISKNIFVSDKTNIQEGFRLFNNYLAIYHQWEQNCVENSHKNGQKLLKKF